MPKCILVVDDDPVIIRFVQRTLQGSGYEVMTAQDGLEALESLKKQIPDLILLDVGMPKMDGYAFIMEKSNNPAFAGIPVIVLTTMDKTEPLFKRHGVKAYLLKPIETQELLDKIKSIVEP
jgi:two-component system chemotaxis response regulator CheY